VLLEPEPGMIGRKQLGDWVAYGLFGGFCFQLQPHGSVTWWTWDLCKRMFVKTGSCTLWGWHAASLLPEVSSRA